MDISDQIRLLKILHPKEQWLKDIIPKLQILEKQENELSKYEVLQLAKRIKPVMRGKDNSVTISNEQIYPLYWVNTTSVAANSFKTTPIREVEGLQEIARITTYHRYNYFKFVINPSLEECIRQCPSEIRDKVCAVEIIADVSNVSKIYDCRLDRHVLTTVYYTGDLPKDIANQNVKWE